jgi:hypothetical protein
MPGPCTIAGAKGTMLVGLLLLTPTCKRSDPNAGGPTAERGESAHGDEGPVRPEHKEPSKPEPRASSSSMRSRLHDYAPVDIADAPGEFYEGWVTWAFELYTFTPCGKQVTYWLEADQAASHQIMENIDLREDGPFGHAIGQGYIRGKATLSEPGKWGHVGRYERQITFHAVERTKDGCRRSDGQ